jgi:ABC-2 type transport system permease protein
MSVIGLIIKREYITRVRKKSFLVMTILGPVLFAATVFLPALFANTNKDSRKVVVVDESHSFCGILNSTNAAKFDYNYCNLNIDQVRNIFADSDKVSVLYISPKVEQEGAVNLYSKTDPNSDVASDIEYEIDNILERSKMKAENIDPGVIDRVKTSIKVSDIVNNKISNNAYSIILGFVCSFLIYMFIFLYSIQVMRGVMEEKINRIVEIIITSVKPFQLMMGKVIGVCLVGLTQFLIWVVMSMILFSLGSGAIQNAQVNPANAQIEKTMKQGMSQQGNLKVPSADNTMSKADAIHLGATALENIERTNWPLIIGCFIFYFLAGYMLYSSFFAAIGSAVDQETETQQFMLPVTAPLILSIIVMQRIIQDPQSTLAFWFSIIPFTSPITMMARIPFGIPIWQLLLSMSLLVLTIFGTIWLAGRIYRVGLLMYGKKITYRELGKWLFYK